MVFPSPLRKMSRQHLNPLQDSGNYTVYHLIHNTKTITYCGTKIKIRSGPNPQVTKSPELLHDTEVITLVAGLLFMPTAQ
jgi:hypothetical protein